MTRFAYDNLSPIEFEELVGALLYEETGVRYERFTPGPDGGIDLRALASSGKSHVVQCKHYPGAPFSRLRQSLKAEKTKVDALAPSRYSIFTTVGLTPGNKTECVAMLTPHILSPDDIWGRQEIDDLLTRHPGVEVDSPKLWLSSARVLQAILNHSTVERSTFLAEEITTAIKLYVPTSDFAAARKILENKRVCIISGEPGVGKTFLAKMLVADAMASGYHPVAVSDDIEQAWSTLAPRKAQIFFYDDFLGMVNSAEKLGKNEDKRLVSFIKRVSEDKSKLLILTTREYLMRQAEQDYEALDDSQEFTQRYILNLSSYGRFEKARILYNHVYHSQRRIELCVALRETRTYLKIVDHRAFSPRMVEHLVSALERELVEGSDVADLAIELLDNPSRVWGHAFERHLSQEAQSLLWVLWSMRSAVELSALEAAAMALGAALGRRPGQRESRAALRVVEGTFLTVRRVQGPRELGASTRIVRVANPSLLDFMTSLAEESPEVVAALIAGATAFEQVAFLVGLGYGVADSADAKRSDAVGAVLRAHHQALLESLERTFPVQSVRVTVPAHGEFYLGRVRRSYMGVDERLALVQRMSRRGAPERFRRWMEDQLDERRDLWKAMSGDKSTAIQLVEALTGNPMIRPAVLRDLRESLGSWLLATLHDVEDFEAVERAARELPDLLTDSEMREAIDAFEGWLADLVGHDPPDLDSETLVDVARRGRELSHDFEVPLPEEFDQAVEVWEDEVQHREDEAADAARDYGSGGSRSVTRALGGRWASDEELETLFDGLADSDSAAGME